MFKDQNTYRTPISGPYDEACFAAFPFPLLGPFASDFSSACPFRRTRTGLPLRQSFASAPSVSFTSALQLIAKALKTQLMNFHNRNGNYFEITNSSG